MMQQWLRTLDDDAIADWANKGLLRRGAKTLAGAGAVAWTLQAQQACADLDGHRQHLDGVGFAALHCDCPAYGPCHHLCAFLLGLRERLASGPAEPPAPPAASWLDGDAQAMAPALGAAAMRRALQWMAQGHEAVLTEGSGALVGELSEPDEVTVRLPRAGGLAAATCTCRVPGCAHRALVALQARRLGGAPIPELPASALDAIAQARLRQTRHWLTALVLQGRAAIGPAFLDQGQALSTELRQADLPRPGAVLGLLVLALRDDRASRAGAAEQVPALLAALWMVVRGLERQPMPRPLRELAGVHRRTYRRVPPLCLHGIAAELWRTPAGQRGFSLHLQDAASGRYLSWSVSRGQGLDPLWDSQQALDEETLGGMGAARLLQAAHTLSGGWASDDGRLSAREGTRLALAHDPAPPPPPDDPVLLLQRHLRQLCADPWQRQPACWARLAVTQCGVPQIDTERQRWWLALDGAAADGVAAGLPALRLHGSLQGPQARVFEALRKGLQRGQELVEVFGRVEFTAGRLSLTPASVRWAGQAGYHQLSTDWALPPAGASHGGTA